MMMTVEISMYPLQADYVSLILDFIAKLNTYPGLRVNTTATATTVTGDYAAVMNTLTEMFAWSHAKHGKAVFVTKFIPGYDPD
ncbi:MAG TPA: YkoF family thiamine/hydroxymethylpyrimidine-binding protein [Candidatus Acidoferrum sp.]|nr:YkoF family thiamine/hydroxymethylpyrimidine-binding protein [Candidatus Acidoferrum sp.]